MSIGWQALRLQMPDRVPRTEYSCEGHWPLVRAVTGMDVSHESPSDVRAAASTAFQKAWGLDLIWSTLISDDIFGERKTRMGHAVYAAGGVDYDADIRPLFADAAQVYACDPVELFGVPDGEALVHRFSAHYAANEARLPGAVNMTGIYVTMMSGLIALLGWDTLLTAAGEDLAAFGAFAARYARFIQPYFDALARCDAPCVMVHDDIVWSSGAFMRPSWYRAHIFPHYKRLFAPLVDSGKCVLFTSDGDYTQFVDDIAACGVHGFVLEPLTDMRYIAERYGRTHVIIGNADTRVLLSGSRDDIRAEVKRCMDIGRALPGYFMAVGNHIPPNTPVDNCLYYNDCYLSMCRR